MIGSRRCALVAVTALTLVACGSDESKDSSSGAGGTGGVDGAAPMDGGAGIAGQAGAPTDGGAGAPDGGPIPDPTPQEVQFEAVAPLPAGEQILFNDWNPLPNAVFSMQPDGSGAAEVFRVYRVWSMAVSRAGDRVAFSSGDPMQEERYGIALGDAIQHTWIYDRAAETIELVASGNINDECHSFGPGDTSIFVCRRYDFTPEGDHKGYRIGRIDLPSRDFTFLTAEVPLELALSPQATNDGSELYYSIVVITPPSTQVNTLYKQALPAGTPEVVRMDASRPVLSPDGTRYIFTNHADNRALYTSKLDGSETIKVASEAGTEARWSPDGSRIAYLSNDLMSSCSHIDAVASDGSEADTPTRLRDCSVTGEFITELAWVALP